jgi:WD40 repeat protein
MLALRPARHVSRLEAHEGRVLAVAVSPDGRSALSAASDRTVRLWDLSCGFEVRTFPGFQGAIRAVAFSPDGRLVAVGGMDSPPGQKFVQGVVRIHDVESGQELRHFEVDGGVWSLAFAAHGSQLLFGGDDDLRLWDLDSAEVAALISLPGGRLGDNALLSVALSPDGRRALAGCHGSQDARLVDIDRGECLHRFTGRRAWLPLWRPLAVTGVAFSPDGRRVLTGSLDQTARVWDAATGKELTRFRGHRGQWGRRGVVGVAWLPDGDRALSGSEDGTVRLWDTTTGKELARFPHGARVLCLAASGDGRLALSGGSNGVVRVWTLPAP